MASAPLVPFRETVLTLPAKTKEVIGPMSSQFISPTTNISCDNNSSVVLRFILPPPWKDISGISNVRRQFASGVNSANISTGACTESPSIYGAVHRLVMTTQRVSITFRCFSLPPNVTQFLTPETDEAGSSNAHAIASLLSSRNFEANDSASIKNASSELKPSQVLWNQFVRTIVEGSDGSDVAVDYCLLDESALESNDMASNVQTLSGLHNRLLSLGPNGTGPNMLLFSPDATMELYEDLVPPENELHNEEDCDESSGQAKSRTADEKIKLLAVLSRNSCVSQDRSEVQDTFQLIWSRIRGSVVSGFQMLTGSGPLMQEPLQGVGFSIEKIEISSRISGFGEEYISKIVDAFGVDSAKGHSMKIENETESVELNPSMMFSSGQLIPDVRDSLRLCMLGCPLRLVEPIYKCSLQCDQLQLGNLYAVLSRRRGEVIDEDIIEGTTLFILTVSLPVANSFGFAQELLRKTSGSATTPQLFFSHWCVNELDPFWKPITSDEQEEHGSDGAVEHNLPRSFIDGVRRRKGLVVEEKMVASAEKQRTLTRNK